MRRAYSNGFEPPAPVLDVLVSAPRGLDELQLPGKLDTGADICAVPIWALERLDLPPVRMVRAAGFLSALEEVPVYRADLELAGVCLERMEVLATRRPYVIVGRTALRRFLVKLDGPRGQLEISVVRRSKRRT